MEWLISEQNLWVVIVTAGQVEGEDAEFKLRGATVFTYALADIYTAKIQKRKRNKMIEINFSSQFTGEKLVMMAIWKMKNWIAVKWK